MSDRLTATTESSRYPGRRYRAHWATLNDAQGRTVWQSGPFRFKADALACAKAEAAKRG